MRAIPHHLLDIVSSKKIYTAADFKRDAEKALRHIIKKGKLPIVCGGTGFYIEALLGNTLIPDVPPNNELRKKLSNKSSRGLFKILQGLDAKRANTIDPKNTRRLIRAIEIALARGKTPPRTSKSIYNLLFIGTTLPKEKLKKKISLRLFARIREGMITEAKRLHANGLSWKRMDELGLEYRYLAKFIRGEVDEEEMERKLESEIWKYAKRQMTWFKRNKRINWYDMTEKISFNKISSKVRVFIES